MKNADSMRRAWLEMANISLNSHLGILSGNVEYNGDIEQIKVDAEFIYRLIDAIENL